MKEPDGAISCLSFFPQPTAAGRMTYELVFLLNQLIIIKSKELGKLLLERTDEGDIVHRCF